MAVSVVWATPRLQEIVELVLPRGTCAGQAIAQSGLIARHGIDMKAMRIAVHGRLAHEDTELADGDRVEICRALVVDPKEARRARARMRPLRAR